jgi:hypothetical protein
LLHYRYPASNLRRDLRILLQQLLKPFTLRFIHGYGSFIFHKILIQICSHIVKMYFVLFHPSSDTLTMSSNPVIPTDSRTTLSLAKGSKAEWRDPDTLFCAMPHQGVRTRKGTVRIPTSESTAEILSPDSDCRGTRHVLGHDLSVLVVAYRASGERDSEVMRKAVKTLLHAIGQRPAAAETHK